MFYKHALFAVVDEYRGYSFLVSWSMMQLAVVSVLWWAFSSIPGTTQEIQEDIAVQLEQASTTPNVERNTSDGSSIVNIQITEYPVGTILLISPEKVLSNSSDIPPVKNYSSSTDNPHNCLQNAFNKTIETLRKQVNEISSKVSVLESKLERRLIHDVKNSPNVFFVPPKSDEIGSIDQSALDNLRGRKSSSGRVEWIIPLPESTTPAPEPPAKYLFSKDIPQSSTASTPQQQIDLLNRAKRRSERTSKANNLKPRVLNLCARIVPVERDQNLPSSPSLRRTKRTRRDISTSVNRLKSHVTMSEWLRTIYEHQERLKELRNAAVKTWLASKLERNDLKVDDVRLLYHGENSSGGVMKNEDDGDKNFFKNVRTLGERGKYVSINEELHHDDLLSPEGYTQEEESLL